jgi:hypothetical protein
MKTIIFGLLTAFLLFAVVTLGVFQFVQFNELKGIKTSVDELKTQIVPTKITDGLPDISLVPSVSLDNVTPGLGMKLKFYVEDMVKDPEVMNCNAPTYVERVLPATSTPLADVVKYLYTSLKLTEAEKAAGLVNEFENPLYTNRLVGFTLKRATITNKVASLTFEDPLYFTSRGSCAGGILASQVTETAKQFPTVNSVTFLPVDTLFQP